MFNGSNQSLSVSPGITFGSGAFTLEGWFYNNSSFKNHCENKKTHENHEILEIYAGVTKIMKIMKIQ